MTTAPVRYLAGDVTRDQADLLVNTVNTVGVMGKGVALAFKSRWPTIMGPYLAACRNGRLRPGGCIVLPLPDGTGRRWAALATKAHWRHPSTYDWIATGLAHLRTEARRLNVRSIALPPPGCGNGGLDWTRVHPLVLEHLAEFDLRIYAAAPGGDRMLATA